MPDPRTAILTRRYQERTNRIAERAAAAMARVWDDMPSHDEADVPEFDRRTRSIREGAKRAAVAAAVGYYSMLGMKRPPSISPDDLDITFDPRGPFIAYWNGLQLPDA